ncbi:MAG: glycine cleavage system aminomethyltransferase GcvT [Chloroflexi bacterium]|nr:glycine cleavage system aminomethyltransferase GcvT [Chloroflexota bacterium]
MGEPVTAANLKKTPLYQAHVALGARIVDFAGWAMPLQYTSILEEHRAVRGRAGMFDVSHMGRLNLTGPDAAPFLQWIVASDVRRLSPGHGCYSVICTEGGGILDDVILYCLATERFHLVCNAANREAVVACLRRYLYSFLNAQMEDVTEATGMVALQGPEAARHLALLGDDGPRLAETLPYFGCQEATVAGRQALVARTGYTGEDGFELIASAQDLPALWERLRDQGVTPCGLGARDTLRLEAALALHGHDISPETSPLEAGLGWVVHLDKGPFLGYDELVKIKATGPARRLVGFEMTGRGIPRAGYRILRDGTEVGRVTSGGPAPTLGKNIGLGYVPAALAQPGTELTIDIRGTQVPARVVRRPFYRRREAAQSGPVT